jgi:hypothetical protein
VSDPELGACLSAVLDVTRLRRAAQEIGLLPADANHDWWLLDDARLIVMQFDQNGRRVHTELVTDPAQVDRAKTWWQLAHAHSAPIEASEPA